MDSVYILTNTYKCPIDALKKAINVLLPHVNMVAVSAEDIREAIDSQIADFEDAVQIACATRNGCGIIISSDKLFKRYTDIPVFTPEEFIAKLTGGN